MTTPAPTPIDYRTAPPKLTAVATGWQAWWEDVDTWDGFTLYADLDTAKHHAAVAYISDEHSWHADDDPADEAPDVVLTWAFAHSRWHLLADGKGTGIQLYRHSTYATATPHRRLTELEHHAAWHAIEGAAGEEGADPDTVLNAVLAALDIDPPAAPEAPNA
ncbi:hypothetical protein J7E97_07960 [Streptomyces sp. ISL-66]|uniref:hypothetical protein n=1 Tax=Streptomyces sp. ISL-66 TaxID=2819186 RepID=UPI001BEA4F4C|nr:hypothetical protein [Streptomyces sp. ISL-66]MBT2467808.1 hypothetical protein [Streptomyces sp. ISL-66]